MARNQPQDDLLRNRGIIKHYADLVPGPSPTVIAELRQGDDVGAEAVDVDVQDFDFLGSEVAVDGSCSTSPIRGMGRAAWSQVYMGEGEEIFHVLSGVVAAPMPQTPQAAEQVAMAQLAETLRRPSVVHADCMASITLANKQVADDQLQPRCRYAGCRRWALAQKGGANLLEARHVRAHRSSQVMRDLEPSERRRALANDLADRAAEKRPCCCTRLRPPRCRRTSTAA